MASQIQQEISSLFYSTINQVKDDDTLDHNAKVELEDPDDVIYQSIDGLHTQIGDDHEELILAQEVSEFPVMEDAIVEMAEIDRRNLPRKLQAIQKSEKQKVVKTRSIKSEKNDSYTIVQLPENNVKLYQCEICNRTFKEKSKLKAHREIHTTERNVICPVSFL